MSMETNKCCLTEKEAAIYISMRRSYLRQDRMHGIRLNRTPGPSYIKIGCTIRYRQQDLDQWILQHRVEHHPDDFKSKTNLL